MNKTEQLLRRVRLEPARDPEFTNGSSEHGYDFIAPLNAHGNIDLDAWKAVRQRIRGDATHDESGFRFDSSQRDQRSRRRRESDRK
jgi:hypothetical protein